LSNRRALAWIVVSLLCQLALLFASLSIAAGIFQSRERQDRARLNELERQMQVLCGRKNVTGVHLTGRLQVKVTSEKGC
jgi:hypothetical protein